MKNPIIRIDTDRRQVFYGNKPVKLTATEFDLINTLANARGKVLSREVLMEKVWERPSNSWDDTRTVDQHVSRVRRRFGANDIIRTLPQVGYAFGWKVDGAKDAYGTVKRIWRGFKPGPKAVLTVVVEGDALQDLREGHRLAIS